MRSPMIFLAFILALVLVSAGFIAPHSLVSGKSLPSPLRYGRVHHLAGGDHKMLFARQRTYQSNRTQLDTTWKDITLFKLDGALTETENTTIEFSVEIACVLCYIKGTAQATLKVPGDGDVVDRFIDYKKSVGGTIDNITTEAFGPVQKHLTQGAEKLVKATNVLENQMEKIAEKVGDKVIEVLNIDTSAIETIVDQVAETVKDFITEMTKELKEIATNLENYFQDITENALKKINNILKENEFLFDYLDDLEERITNLSDKLVKVFKDGVREISSELMETFHLDSFEFPTIDIDFNLPDIDPIPDLSLSFALDDFELYLELELTLAASATYTMSLFRSHSSLGIALPDAYAGAVVAIDLILTAEVEVQLQGGFHLKVDNSIVVDIGMFSQDISEPDFPGGQFEFLPVTVSSGSGKVMGVLRVELKAGLELQNHTMNIFGKELDFGAGVEVSVFANVAQFEAEISVGDDTECQLGLGFEFNVGAAAGATLVLDDHAWGPAPETSFSIYGTKTESLCKMTSTSTLSASTSSVAITTDEAQGRGALFLEGPTTTKTLSSTVIYSGVSCKSTGMVNCPASLQTTTTSASVVTHVTVIPVGETPTFPPSSVNEVQSTVTFGSNAQFATAAGPSSSRPFFHRETGGVSNKIIVGVSIALGVPVLISVVVFLWLLRKRNKRKNAETTSPQ